MERYAYVESLSKQVFFNQPKRVIDILKKNIDGFLFIKQKRDEALTIQALQKKYKIKILWQAVFHTDTFTHFGYIVQDKT